VGGGANHRFGLFDGVVIKTNHLAAVSSITDAVRLARENSHHLLKIEVEITSLAELEEALAAGADIIMLDNMDEAAMAQAVTITAGRALLEASGSMTLERLPAVAATGVNLISMGALTHSAPAVDIHLRDSWGRRAKERARLTPLPPQSLPSHPHDVILSGAQASCLCCTGWKSVLPNLQVGWPRFSTCAGAG
jgi:hypothetical protein